MTSRLCARFEIGGGKYYRQAVNCWEKPEGKGGQHGTANKVSCENRGIYVNIAPKPSPNDLKDDLEDHVAFLGTDEDSKSKLCR